MSWPKWGIGIVAQKPGFSEADQDMTLAPANSGPGECGYPYQPDAQGLRGRVVEGKKCFIPIVDFGSVARIGDSDGGACISTGAKRLDQR